MGTKFSKLEYLTESPISMNNDKSMNIIYDTIPIYYTSKKMLFCFPYRYLASQNEKIEIEIKKFDFFIFHRGSKIGSLFSYSNGVKSIYKELNVDSLLRIRVSAFNFFKPDENYHFVSSQKDKNGDIVNVYDLKFNVKQEGESKIVYYLSKSYRKLPVKLLKKRIKNRELYKVVKFNESFYDAKRNLMFPAYKTVFELKKTQVLLNDTCISLLKK